MSGLLVCDECSMKRIRDTDRTLLRVTDGQYSLMRGDAKRKKEQEERALKAAQLAEEEKAKEKDAQQGGLFGGFMTDVRRSRLEAENQSNRNDLLGGMMGLLLGFSVITGFELLFFLFDYLYMTMKYRCSQEYLSYILKQDTLTSSCLTVKDSAER